LNYIAYLDEFGHIGPYKGRDDPKYNDSPIFGLGGLILPFDEARSFATWFFQLKCNLLEFEIKRDGIHPAKWEKKGASLYTTKNVQTYSQVRKATNRLLNKISSCGGHVFYVGLQKRFPPGMHDPISLYRAVLMEAIKRLDQYCTARESKFLVIIDQQGDEFRKEIVEASGRTMFGEDGRKSLIEPPIQAESHLYQTLQCADWICGLVGRLGCYWTCRDEYSDWEWSDRYFGDRIRKAASGSGIRKQ
jgi:Protein of unknown function (DUF3800)